MNRRCGRADWEYPPSAPSAMAPLMSRPVPKSFHIKSFGCQMNVYDGACMAELMQAQGMGEAGADDADLVLLNTCHIREKAAEKVYSDIGRLAKRPQRLGGGRPLIAPPARAHPADGGRH